MKQGHQQQRYRVLERLASGGMAEVFLAESAGIEGFKKRVAIKRVLPQLSEKKRFIAMFLDEARLSANLTHSNVAQVFDIGVGDNAYFIVMEYVDGSDLKGILEFAKKTKRTLPVEVVAYIAEKMCDGLSYAHEAKGAEGQPLRIVHRDVSPANVLVTKYGEIKIVDFGLAKATSQLEKSEPGIVKGKFGYLSPEATQGVEVDARADVFAVGIILWEMLAQKRLFLGESDLQTVMRVREAIVPPLAPLNKDVPQELEKIIQKALARDPEKRFQTARELGRALNAFLFKFGKPVGAHDVADLVHGTVALRNTGEKEKDTTLSRLIEEALLEFKSLDTEQQSRPAQTPKPAAVDEPRGRVSKFEDIGKWAEEVESIPTSADPQSLRPPPPSRKPTSEPAETVKATPAGKAEEGKAETTPAETIEEVPATPAEESKAESLPATTVKSPLDKKSSDADEDADEPEPTPAASAREDKPKESLPAATLRATPKAKKKKNLTNTKSAKPTREVAKAQEKNVDGSGNVMWLYVAAAILLALASAYYSGIFGSP